MDNWLFATRKHLIWGKTQMHVHTHAEALTHIHTRTHMHTHAPTFAHTLMHRCRIQRQNSQIMHLIPFWVPATFLTLSLVKHRKINPPFWLLLLLN